MKCLFSVCLAISLFFCLAVNNCVGNILDFSEFSRVARGFLEQSYFRTFENSMLMEQALSNMYIHIINCIETLIVNELIKSFSLVKVRRT